MQNRYWKISPIIIASLIIGCVHTYKSVIPSHIKTISFSIAINSTLEYGLEETFTNALIQEFIRDGQYKIVNQPDGQGELVVTINSYTKEPDSYDSKGIVTRYRISVSVAGRLLDKSKNSILWEGEISNTETFIPHFSSLVARGFTPRTIDEVKQKLFSQLAYEMVSKITKG